MLHWTAGGAVPAPTTVQIRVHRRYPGRVRAGAPAPSRSLDPDELLANVIHFTAGMRGPRQTPCNSLVLSGSRVAARPDLGAALARARAEGVRRVVLHAGSDDLGRLDARALAALVDVLVLPVQPDEIGPALSAMAAAAVAGLPVATHTVLDAQALHGLVAVADALAETGLASHTFTFPFPVTPDHPAPLAADAMAALGPALARFDAAGVRAGVKGLPACYLGVHSGRLGRTANRWYVDAEHQLDAALLFFPDVVAFHKGDACRFCGHDDRCDGFFQAYLDRDGFPALAPLTSA